MAKQQNGSGVPAIERFIGGLLIKRWCKRCPPEETLALCGDQRDEFGWLARQLGDRATERVQIKRLPGLEASSTSYSLAMTIEHVGLVNTGLAELLESLRDRGRYDIEVKTADYKAHEGVSAESAMELVQEAQERLALVLEDTAWLETDASHEHPWFGALPARTWACFPAFHGALHVKQAKLIAQRLGV